MAENYSDETILDIDQACEFLRTSKSTIYKLAQNDQIPCQKVGRQWRFSREMLERWLVDSKSRRRKGESGPVDFQHLWAPSGVGVQSELAEFFSGEQVDVLKEYSIETKEELLRKCSNERSRLGLACVLDMSGDDLQKILRKIAVAFIS